MKSLLVLVILGVFCFLTVTILAQVPQLLNYQGRLTDNAGVPISTATTLRFSLYQGGDAFTAGSGLLVYEEEASVTPDSNGVFSHLIGSGMVISGTLDATVFQTASPVYLEITIDPDGLSETLLPREQIVTVGYSFKSELAEDADTVDGQDAADFASAVHPHDALDVVSGKLDNARLNMGHGNGINADMVDNLHESAFSKVGHNHDPVYVNVDEPNSVTSSMVVNGTIVDADINASANITASKINRSGLNADLLDGTDSTGFASYDHNHDTRYVNVSGDSMSGQLYIDFSAPGYGNSVLSVINPGTNGTGIEGRTIDGASTGVRGTSFGSEGYGVAGIAEAPSGNNYGVYGRSNSTSGIGVYGYTSATSGPNEGVYGRSDSPNGFGMAGLAYATSGTNYGVWAASNSPNGYGVYGTNGVGGWAAYFLGKVHVQGTFTSSDKRCVQEIEGGKKVTLYVMESPEYWFEDFGTAQLVNGRAVVQLERVFAQTVNTEAVYFVFPIPNEDCQGLYISKKDWDSFEVRELGGGTSNITFDYRIVAKRRGYENLRLEEFRESKELPEEAKPLMKGK